MKSNNKNKHWLETQSYINAAMHKLEKDITKYVEKSMEKKSKLLQQEFKRMVLSTSERSHQRNVNNFFNTNKNSSPYQNASSFNLSGNQLLTSLVTEIRNNLFNNF
ncbi:hypothetical protein NF27_EY02080 [Candidatus Jidaibacter acanthamoeba]|uniref:Uncharacterized protein n=1 Tax=Candidatus Jidaibacter acanthamoebae TaxID=86105 RepID=A0A0C1MSR8_9RICK|nr:hypothetical protein [Candidatus Jidaibacter acanthamoeba]KIE05112.1 hypothetical protein NF27_EY02080 [Candidatus Jidaibacter acanthamoeba]